MTIQKKEEKNDRITSLDGLRGLCAFAVAFLFHFQMFGVEVPFRGLIKTLYETGWLAVDIFFVISGFAISLTYENKIAKDNISFYSFIIKRVKHLYPIMHVTLFVCTLEHLLYFIKMGKAYWFSYFDIPHFILNFLGIQSGWFEATLSFNGPAWCISVEMLLYILSYFIVKVTRKNKVVLYCVESIGILLGLIILKKNLLLPFLNQFIARGVIGFFVGMIIKDIWLKYEKRELQERYVKWSVRLSAIAIFVWFLLCYFVGTESWIWGQEGILFVFVISISPMSVWLALTGRLSARILNLRVLRALGNISLEIYMWHFPVMVFIVLLDVYNIWDVLNGRSLFIVYVCSVLLVSIIYKFVTTKIESLYCRREIHVYEND